MPPFAPLPPEAFICLPPFAEPSRATVPVVPVVEPPQAAANVKPIAGAK